MKNIIIFRYENGKVNLYIQCTVCSHQEIIKRVAIYKKGNKREGIATT